MKKQTERNRDGVVVDVPIFPKLKELRDQAAKHASMVSTLEKEMLQISQERVMGDERNVSTADLMAWSAQRDKLKSAYDGMERRKAIAEQAKLTADGDYQQWVNLFASLIYRRKMLSRELATARDGEPYSFVISGNPEGQPRSKTEVEDELLNCMQKLAAHSGDADVQREFEQLAKKIADAKPYVVAQEPYVKLADASVVTQRAFNELALTNEAACQGARTYCGRGCHVPRAEALALGII